VVTIADPTQRAWGFQLTVRLESNTASMAGGFASTDANTLLMCGSTDFARELAVSFSAGGLQTCPANLALQYIEHSAVGYAASRGHAGSQTYEFDWTPPASNVGNLTVY